MYENTEIKWSLTIPLLILLIILLLLVAREFWQLFRYRKRYFTSSENYIEWIIILLVIINILPGWKQK